MGRFCYLTSAALEKFKCVLKPGSETTSYSTFNNDIIYVACGLVAASGCCPVVPPPSFYIYITTTVDDWSDLDKHTQKPKQTQVLLSPMKRTNVSLCVFMLNS